MCRAGLGRGLRWLASRETYAVDMQPIEPNRPMHATLTAEQWEAVLRHLDAGQHGVVRPIIDALMQQLREQSQARLTTDDLARVMPDGPSEEPNA